MSTTISSGSVTSTSSIDVASIVSGLMAIENKPVDTLNTRVSNNKLKITDLGNLKAKLASFQTSLEAFQTTSNYSSVTGVSSNPSSLQATTSVGAVTGRSSVLIKQTAESSQINISQFNSATESLVNLGDGESGLTIQIGEDTYNTNGSYSKADGSSGTVSALTSPVSITQLSSWINQLASANGAAIQSNIVQVSSSPQSFAIAINGTSTGKDYAIALSGLNGQSISTSYDETNKTMVSMIQGSNTGPNSEITTYDGAQEQGTISVNANARDAFVAINGLDVQRSSNTITGVLAGVTLNLINPIAYRDYINPSFVATPSFVTIAAGEDNSKKVMNDLIDSYNSMIGVYQKITASSDSTTSVSAGSFSTERGLFSYVSGIKQLLAKGVRKADGSVASLSALGIDLQGDGTLKFNSTSYANAVSSGDIKKLASGLTVGYESSSANLRTRLTQILGASGSIATSIQMEVDNNSNLNKKIAKLSANLVEKEKSLTAQYAKLNALLYTLSQTSSRLTASLDGLTAMNSGN
jgi:flagellar hook-associated protein 2